MPNYRYNLISLLVTRLIGCIESCCSLIRKTPDYDCLACLTCVHRWWSWRVKSCQWCFGFDPNQENGSGWEPAPSPSRTRFQRRLSISSVPTSMSSESHTLDWLYQCWWLCNMITQSNTANNETTDVWSVTVVKDPSVWMLAYPPQSPVPLYLTTSPFNKPHTDHFLPTPLFCTRLWLWGSRNSTQDPLTPISSPGGSLPPSLGQSSPNCPPVVLSPGQVATRWDQAWPDYPPPAWESRGCFMGDYCCS